MTERSERCETCRFWEKDGTGLGHCYRYPPQMFPTVPKRGEGVWLQPQTFDNDWCGEWQDKEVDHVMTQYEQIIENYGTWISFDCSPEEYLTFADALMEYMAQCQRNDKPITDSVVAELSGGRATIHRPEGGPR